MSGTLSGDKFTERAFLSKASLSILFFVADPQSLYKPIIHKRTHKYENSNVMITVTCVFEHNAKDIYR